MKATMLVLAAMTMQLGCSWMTVEGPPRHPTPVVDCTTSKVAPGVDTGIAVIYGAAGVVLMVAGSAVQDDSDDDVGGQIGNAIFLTGLLGVATALPFALSASHGYSRVNACRRAKARAMPQYPQPQPQYPPPLPPYPPPLPPR